MTPESENWSGYEKEPSIRALTVPILAVTGQAMFFVNTLSSVRISQRRLACGPRCEAQHYESDSHDPGEEIPACVRHFSVVHRVPPDETSLGRRFLLGFVARAVRPIGV